MTAIPEALSIMYRHQPQKTITMIEKIIEKFYQEFKPINYKFEIISLTISEAYVSSNPMVAMPGVYIFWYEKDIVKVGRNLLNSRKRALEHIRDNTENEFFQMNTLEKCLNDCGLVLINCKNKENSHWIAALEIYMEKELKPIIRSRRTG